MSISSKYPYWLVKTTNTGKYVKESWGKVEYVDSPAEATSFGRTLAIEFAKRDSQYKVVKITGKRASPPATSIKKRITHVGICLDSSGSMGSVAAETKKAVNEVLDTIRESAKAKGHESDVSFWTFGVSSGRSKVMSYNSGYPFGKSILGGTLNHEVREDYFRAPAANAPEIYAYVPSGGTPLSDSIGNAIERLMTIQHAPDDDYAFLLQIITDGEENQSTKYSVAHVREAIEARQNSDKWTFSFLVPPGKKAAFVRLYGVPDGNVREWERTTVGVQNMSIATRGATSAYYGARSMGETKSVDFFADLSKVSPQSVASKLTDVTNKVKATNVDKEVGIKEFVESHGQTYRRGDSYYPLTKKELVQLNKRILVQDKKTNRIYTGNKVRDVLGLPTSGDLKINPLNLSYFNLFVQSTSDNRRLVRGTQLVTLKPGESALG